MHRKHGIKLLVIDYLQMLHAVTGRKEVNREREVANISNGVKSLLKELNIPGIIVAQLNRDMEKDKNRKPRLSDLRESGAIEQDADIIGMIYSAEDEPKNPEIVPVNLLIAKQRNGPTGDVGFTFFKAITRFEPRAMGYES
jgi:replicative DNA helicase